jgi:acyl transferase domain-containing protein
MPGELANCIAGRIANVFNFHGPNYVVDAACASAMAAISAAAEGLVANDFDIAVTGGIDRNMGASTYIKFCKIGALSATGTRPYAEGADGFVMGEGTAIFLLKRLADAERDGDKIYAVLRGIAGSSDGKGKGITAPNPIGQKFAIERAWQNAGLSPATVTFDRGPWHIHRRGRRRRSAKHDRRAQQFSSPLALSGAWFGQVELRAP